ncbi:initiation factor 2 [Annulohypoxylon truncatum]|uniref:initiation factor 2 n=1 Tax=Annulohypoxylon truncatum TaxID=327061 RepID=UPI0020088E24|nr:initiation factor 2 [Annulohypoxylon truncatum]KAI1207533.1 initiation factor 2 [Annulohypoxylon truncatum]
MLRASLSKRESSICAFCQHRLSLRTATPRNRRQLSGTRSLKDNDGWGNWGGGWGSQPKAPAQSQQDDILDPAELIARKKLLEKQQQQQRAQQLQQTPEPPKTRVSPASLGPRYMWNADKQQAVEQSLRRDSLSLRNNNIITRDIKRLDISSFGRKLEEKSNVTREPSTVTNVADTSSSSTKVNGKPVAKRLIRYEFGSSRGGHVGTKPEIQRKLGDNSITPSNLSQPLQSQPLRPPPLQPSQSSQPPQTSQPSQPSQPPQTLQPPLPPQSTGESDWGITGDSDWGMLARKLTPPEPDSENFWAAMTQNGKDKEEKKSQASNAASQAPGKSKPQDPWANMASQLNKASEHKDSYDWGVELGEENAREAKRLQSSKEKPQESAPVLSQTELSMEQGLKGQDRVRDRDRERRLSRFEREEDDSHGREKRSRRRGQKHNDDDEGGFDYEDYAERRRTKARLKAQREAERVGPRPILIPELINIKALAEALKVEPKLFLTQLGELGFEGVSLDSLMAGETAALVAQEYGFEPTVEAGEELDLKPRPPPEDPTALPLRPPVVTIMGHVDHGKTTLLDYLRKSSIAAQEHGGITQRIGAFSVKLSSGKPITFLDTPGHAAFLTMRQRGAYVTDIVVLVVAADDSVKPQTIEAIRHARAAKVPMIVAINKIDKEGARIDQVKNDLAQEGVEIEDFGGDVQVVCVSGKTGQGMEDLEENILTLSEILDHRAELDGPAEGWILESNLKPMGKAATVLVKRGTMRIGDYIAAGLTWGKIRHIRNEAGVEVGEALPGTPVEILGWKELPAAGDQVIQGSDEARVKAAVEYREGLRELEKDAAAHEEISESRRLLQEKRAREKELAEAGDSYEALPEEKNGTKMVNFSVKGDLHGSVEAVEASILELGSHEVRPRILRSGTGPIHEFDVEHAAMSKSVIVNFATTTPGYIKQMAEEQGVKILDHTVIYHVVDEVKAILSTYLAPEVTNKVLGEAEVLQIFPINIKGRMYKNIAGCKVRNGTLEKGRLFRVIRRGETIFDGYLETLKHLKKDVTEVKKGTECGLGFDEFQDFEIGDQIQAYEKVETERFF